MVAHEVRRKAIAATEAIYRITAIESFDPVLKFELRKRSIGVLTHLAALGHSLSSENHTDSVRLIQELEIVKEFICLARDMHSVTPQNAERILGAYEYVRNGVPANNTESHPSGDASENGATENKILNGRQVRILEHIDGIGRAQMSHLRSLFTSEVSEKTLQRDLGELVTFGLLKRLGDKRWTTYISIGH